MIVEAFQKRQNHEDQEHTTRNIAVEANYISYLEAEIQWISAT